MLGNLEEKIEAYLDKTPFIAKMYFGHELSVLKNSLEESKKLRAKYVPTEQWYIDYALNLNKGTNAIYNVADRAYATYDAIKTIPIIGKPICSFIEGYIADAMIEVMPVQPVNNHYSSSTTNNATTNTTKKITIPEKATTLKVIENVGNLGIEGLCAHYELSTGKSADNIRSQVRYTPTPYQTDPSPFRKYFVSTLESIGNFFNELFGVKPNYSTS
jgi:hypothetical protein